MAASHKGAISFGLVHIPIALYTATQDNDFHFNQLCKEDLSRVRYKKTCAGCGKEITNKDIVKAFELLRQAMKQENKIAVAKTVMGQKETLLAVIPTDVGILIETLFYADEIKELPKEYSHPAVSEAELAMAKTLINSMNQEFQPELYKDEYQERLKALIEQKIAGKEIVSAKQEEQGNVIDLMEALKASIEQAGSNKPKRGGRSKKVKGAS